jgi:hypothetical protein
VSRIWRGIGGNTLTPESCWCFQCDQDGLTNFPPFTSLFNARRRMNLCPRCGNKRCPLATDHRNVCTGSNEPGQAGSLYGPPVRPNDTETP